MKNAAEISERRRRFQAAKLSEGEALNTCTVCGRTDVQHPQLGFRVNAAGEDVCDDCRAKTATAR
jgi:hypothetical protein